MSDIQNCNIFDEINEFLKDEQGRNPLAYVEKHVMSEFMSSDFETPAKPSVTIGYKPSQQTVINHPSPSQFIKYEPAKPVIAADYPELKSMQFEELSNAVLNCRRCILCSTRTNTVFGEGNVRAELMMIGEGPGQEEDEQGRPFVGKAGQLLTKMIKAMGYEREDIYIANIVKCRPPNNRNPNPEEAAACIPFLERQIEIINPRVIILLGAVSLKYLMNQNGITKLRGQWLEYKGKKVMPTFHPSYLLRDESQKKYAWADLQKVMAFLGKMPRKG